LILVEDNKKLKNGDKEWFQKILFTINV
jgi:hypothetical protein